MKLFGLTITRTRRRSTNGLVSPGASRGGWWPLLGGAVRESFPGAWQQNVEVTTDSVLAHAAVYACVTLIASDIGKLRVKLVYQNEHDIWVETTNTAHSPVLRKPNRYQNRIKFYENWVTSKLIFGNTYVLKQRDSSGITRAMYILDPLRVRPLVAPDGAVYYELKKDHLSQVTEDAVVIPASEILHDVMIPLFHPLVGVSPIYACGVSAIQGLRIISNAAKFFGNASTPSGVLTAPGHIPQEIADLMKARWEEAFTGDNIGRVAVLGDGLEYDPMTVNAVDAQLVEQLKWTGENACTAFRVPPYLIGLGPVPANSNPEALTIQYYSQCLQNLIECIELLLDEGLELGKNEAGYQLGTEMDLDDLMRMDTDSKVKASANAIKGGGMAPNEARFRYLDLPPVAGGDSPYLQQQNFSLEALAKRDAKADPFLKTPVTPPAAESDKEDEDEEEGEAPDTEDEDEEQAAGLDLADLWRRAFEESRR